MYSLRDFRQEVELGSTVKVAGETRRSKTGTGTVIELCEPCDMLLVDFGDSRLWVTYDDLTDVVFDWTAETKEAMLKDAALHSATLNA